MTLDEFIAHEHARAERFRTQWLKQAALDDDNQNWPLEMDVAEWAEQFAFFED